MSKTEVVKQHELEGAVQIVALGNQTMKAEVLTDDDARLSTLLRECKSVAMLPPRFQEGVWRRIARNEEQPSVLSSLRSWFARWINTLLPRPALAVSYVAILLVVGASAGWAQARQEKARVSDAMSLRYVQSVDPYQAAR